MLRKLIFTILYYFRIPHLFHAFQRSRKKIPIILFHDVHPEPNRFTGSITPEEFEEIVILLKKKYRISRLDNINNSTTENCYITFDDGMKNFHLYAYPILLKHKIPVTLFIPPASIELGYTWNLKYFDLLAKNLLSEPLDVSILNQSAISKILLRYSSVNIDDRYKLMSWKDLEELDSSIVDIQSHSNAHSFLTTLTIEDLKNDLKNSTEKINAKLNEHVNAIAYPMGDYNQNVVTTAADYFNYGFVTSNKLVKISTIEKLNMTLTRFHIDNPNKLELYARITGVHEAILTVKKWLSIEK